MGISGLNAHLRRIRHQFGRGLVLGTRSFRVRGYFANRLAHDFSHEANLIPALQRILTARQGAVLDIGANVGQTLIKVLSVDSRRRYIAFEPQVPCCFFLQQFITDNHLDNAQVLPMALSDANGICRLYANSTDDEMASIADDTDTTGRRRELSTPVPMRVADEVIAELGLEGIALIKIDVEGAEYRVLQGLQQTLREVQPSLIFEVLPNFFGPERIMHERAACLENQARADRIFELLSGCGYRISQLSDAGEESPVDKFNLDDPARFGGVLFVAHPYRAR